MMSRLLERERSELLVVDVQQRLLPAIADGEAVRDAVGWLVRLAGELDVPVTVSEQYPRGLGHTDETLAALLGAGARVLEKMHFSCAAEPAFRQALAEGGRDCFVIAGTEAHVCVLQTAIGLHEAGFQVAVVADAVGSRRPQDRDLALARLRESGVDVVSREMVAFEWLHRAGTEVFRRLSRELLR